MSDNDNYKSTLIKIAMLQKGITQSDIAKELNITRQTVNKVINGNGVSKRIEEYLNKILRGKGE